MIIQFPGGSEILGLFNNKMLTSARNCKKVSQKMDHGPPIFTRRVLFDRDRSGVDTASSIRRSN